MTGLDLYAILTGWSSTDAEPPAKEHVTARVVCRCGGRLALVVGSRCWVAADKIPKAGAADVVLDAAFLDFEALTAAGDAAALDVAAFVRAVNPKGRGLDALVRALPPLRLPARWFDIAGLPGVDDPERLAVGTSCRRCGTTYRLGSLLAGHTAAIAREADPNATIRGFEWPDTGRDSRVSLYRHLTDVLLA